MLPEHLSLLRRPGRPSAHPDGTWAAVAITRPDVEDDTYPSQIWRVDLETGDLRPLTHGFRDAEPVISPDGTTIAFLRQAKGGRPQLAVMPADGGEPRLLTDHPVGVSGRPVFSPGADRVAYTARVPQDGRYGTLKDVGPEAEPPRHITRFTYRSDGIGFYGDRPQHVFVIDVPRAVDPAADPPVSDDKDKDKDKDDDGVPSSGRLASSGVEPVRITTEQVDHRAPVWTADGASLLIVRPVVDGLTSHLVRHEAVAASPAEVLDVGPAGADAVVIGEGEEVWLLIADYGEDNLDFIGRSDALYRARLTAGGVEGLERLTDPVTESLGGTVFAAVPGGAVLTRERRGTVELVRWADGGLTPLLDGPVEVTGGATAGTDGSVLVSADAVGSVGDLWLVAPDGERRQVTDLSARLREEAGVITPAELEVPGDDGYPVHGWVALPDGDGPHPVLLLIHGGPHAQYEPTFFDEVQVYAQAGYAVVFCNPRGSAGYGQEHGRAIIGGFGDRDAADVLAFLDGALAAHASLDAERMGVLGGSYGGYLTAWLTTRTDRFAAAIVERGFLDPVSFEGSSDIGWFFGVRYVGEDPVAVAAQSPMAHIDKVTTPTLVIHSEQDWRCPVEQGQRWFVGLKRRGVEAELLLFPGEGHELSRSGRPKHRIARFEHILRWWDKYLPAVEPSGAAPSS